MAGVVVHTVFNHIPRLIAELQPRADAIVEKHAKAIAAGARQRTVRVDTGAMRDGFKAEKVGGEWTVWNEMPYHIFHELGTVNLSASPMLIPAIEEERPKLRDDLAQNLIPGARITAGL